MEVVQCQTTVLLPKCCEHWPINGEYFWESVAQGTLVEPHHDCIVGRISAIRQEILCNSFFGLGYYQNCHCTFRSQHNDLSHLIQETLPSISWSVSPCFTSLNCFMFIFHTLIWPRRFHCINYTTVIVCYMCVSWPVIHKMLQRQPSMFICGVLYSDIHGTSPLKLRWM